MCTYFTLHYTCGHIQTSHRCPRSTVTVYGANGVTTSQIKGCGSRLNIGGGIQDKCIECKMKEGHQPGAATGLDRWAEWGRREEGISKRQRTSKSDEGFREMDPVLLAGGRTVQARTDWEEQVRACLMDQRREQTGTPETSGTSSSSHHTVPNWKKQRVDPREQEEEDDDWMWGGMKDFGGEEIDNRSKLVALPGYEYGATHVAP